MRITVTTPAAHPPIERERVKELIGVLDGYDDRTIDMLIGAATAWAEAYMRRYLIERELCVELDRFPSGPIVLPFAPVRSVSEIRYTVCAGVSQILATENWNLALAELPPQIRPSPGTTWPVVTMAPDAIEIDVTVGYGAGPDDVPDDIRMAIGYAVAHLKENAHILPGRAKLDMPGIATGMLDPHRVWV